MIALDPTKKMSSPPTSGNPGRKRLLCAVDARERRLFLAGMEARLQKLAGDVQWLSEGSAEQRTREIVAANPEVLLSSWSTPPLPREWLEADNCALRYVCHIAGSVRFFLPRRFIERGGLVTNWGRIACPTVAEQALLLGLGALRNQANWPGFMTASGAKLPRVQVLQTRTLFGRRVGLHGFGGVAQALVRLLEPFGVSLSAYSTGVPSEMMRALGVKPATSLEELFRQSEVVFECEALTPATQGSVSAAVLAALPDGGVFVNVARGALVDEAALLREANSGRIRIALDVIVHEPLTDASPLFHAKDAVFSPHIGGPTFDQYPAVGEFAVENLERYARGDPLQALVTVDIYDRST